MEWRRIPQDDPRDPDGVLDLIERAQAALGGAPLTGTTFLHDARTMLSHTRAIERAVAGADTLLYVGFQTADKLDAQARVYRDLTASGTRVVAYGAGQPAAGTGVEWVEVADHPLRLENQWLLVTRSPEPIAFVGFETSPDALRSVGRAGGPGKSWRGFVSGDKRLVDALSGHLTSVARKAGA